MLRREFGDTGVSVSSISLGCWIFGVDWWGHYSQDDCHRLCKYSMDQGITFFDNGDAYGNGRAEELFGEFVKTVDRDKIEIGGKFGYDWHTDPGEPGSHRERKQDFSPAFMRQSLEDSLRRLNTSHIDVYLAHNIKLHHFSDELFAELEKVKEEGKIRCWGVSLGPAIGWREEGFAAMGGQATGGNSTGDNSTGGRGSTHTAKAVQTVFNVLEQHPAREFCEMAKATKAGVLARVQDHSGILKGQAEGGVTPQTLIKESDHRKFRDLGWRMHGPTKAQMLMPLAQRHGMTLHQLACKWLIQANPQVTSITATLLTEKEIAEVSKSPGLSDFSNAELKQMHDWYESDFGLPPEAHPCDIKTGSDPTGKVRSQYVPPPVLIA